MQQLWTCRPGRPPFTRRKRRITTSGNARLSLHNCTGCQPPCSLQTRHPCESRCNPVNEPGRFSSIDPGKTQAA
ncbi:Unknown protein sequence [Pseudomonas viridiflava]|nr:Unknown protein sequence [Pseudomonas viridiflava]